MKSQTDKIICADIARYKKNKFGASLALIGLVFNCLYFMILYGIKVAVLPDGSFTKFCSIEIGISVILTLVMLLTAFLSSEGVKVYKKGYCIVLLVLAVFQIVRIFGIPLYGLNNDLLRVDYFGINPQSSVMEFTLMTVYLLASAACFIASAVISYINIVSLEKHNKAIESGEMDMDKFLADLNDAENASAKTGEVR